MNTNLFTGVWSLVSLSKQTQEGETAYPWGKDTAGQLIYTQDGYMSVTYMKCGRKRFASNDKTGGTTGEIMEAFANFDAYAGTYEIDDKAGTVMHHVKVSREPNLEGTSLVRHYKLKDNVLQLVTPPILGGGQESIYTLTWQRVS